jgi:putative hydrolases of HD superfamily
MKNNTSNQQIAKRMIDFQAFLFDFTQIDRKIHFPDSDRKDRFENDAEHSYSLSMMGWYLAQFFPELDCGLIIKYSLIHDIPEIYAGDVQAIRRTPSQEKAKVAAEHQAIIKLKTTWSDFPDMNNTIDDYEQQVDSESRFVKALDKLMPSLLNILNDGKTLRLYAIDRATELDHKEQKTKISPEVYKLWKELEKIINSKKSDLFN